MHYLRFLTASTLLSLPFFAFAQATPDQSYKDLMDRLLNERSQTLSKPTDFQTSQVGSYLDVKINPPVPGPNAPVQITIESYLTDLYKANISWSVNGQVLNRGIGKTIFDFQNGPSGMTTRVSLSIITNTGELVEKEFFFSPVGVTMLWEADTYTPPFYKGKALITPEARVRVVAVPESSNIASALGSGDLVYNWRKNDAIDTTASGYGKNSYTFRGPKPLSNSKISLTVSSLDDSAHSEMRIMLPVSQPFVLFYEKDPLLGVLYNKPLSTKMDLNKRDLLLKAEPYFFSNERNESPTLSYNWSVNGKWVRNYGQTLALRKEENTKGTSLISLTVRGVTETFQLAKKELQVSFGETSASSRPLF